MSLQINSKGQILPFMAAFYVNVTLDHKTSHKSHGYICSNSQQFVWVKICDFFFYAKNQM